LLCCYTKRSENVLHYYSPNKTLAFLVDCTIVLPFFSQYPANAEHLSVDDLLTSKSTLMSPSNFAYVWSSALREECWITFCMYDSW